MSDDAEQEQPEPERDGCLTEIKQSLWALLVAILLIPMFGYAPGTSASMTQDSPAFMATVTPEASATNTRASTTSAGPTSTPTPRPWLCVTSETTPTAGGFKFETICKPDDSKG